MENNKLVRVTNLVADITKFKYNWYVWSQGLSYNIQGNKKAAFTINDYMYWCIERQYSAYDLNNMMLVISVLL